MIASADHDVPEWLQRASSYAYFVLTNTVAPLPPRRKEIVVFKEGYRSRSYCLSECTQARPLLAACRQPVLLCACHSPLYAPLKHI